ncbi:MAG: hypothetical protein GKR96_12555 [Gammaproteobacteria bacterium]|nr:hypothetical protein [Gammaproteobacteria bacterium]
MHHLQSRIQLTAAFRWAARMGWQSGICNHFSLAVNDSSGPSGILINPQGFHWSELTASSLLLMNSQGKIIDGEGEVEDTAFFIHLSTHNEVPSATCVLHAHPPYTTAIMCSKPGRIVNCSQDSLRFHGRIAYDDHFGGLAGDKTEGARIAEALGGKPIMLMANHGITVTGPSVAKALDDFYYLELAAKYQVLANNAGDSLNILSDEKADRLSPAIQQIDTQTAGHFQSIQRILDKEEPEYRE